MANLRHLQSLLLALAMSSSACAETLQNSGKQVASGAIEGTVAEANDRDTREAMAALAADSKLREAVSQLSSAVASGVVEGLAEERNLADLETVTQQLAAAVGATLANSLDRDVGPAIERMVARSVRRSLSEALGTTTQGRIEALSAATARGALRGMNEAMEETRLDPAASSIGAMAREIGKEATLGFQDAVRVASRKADPRGENGDGEVLAAVGETADTTLKAAPWVLWGLLALLAGAFGLSAYLLVQRRRERRRVQAVSLALEGLASTDSAETRARIERALATR